MNPPELVAIRQCCRLLPVLRCCHLSGGVDVQDQATTVKYMRAIAEATESTAYSYAILHCEMATALEKLTPAQYLRLVGGL
jgi:hypothetical protein